MRTAGNIVRVVSGEAVGTKVCNEKPERPSTVNRQP
jgi:hypothetical protein